VVVAPPSPYDQAAKWPLRTHFSANWKDVRFVNFKNGNGGDYTLAPGSPYKRKANGAKDIGADVSAVNTATAGVE
jgi:hypothetical protein